MPPIRGRRHPEDEAQQGQTRPTDRSEAARQERQAQKKVDPKEGGGMSVSPDVFREQAEAERDQYKRALDEIALGVPKEDEWDSAADFMEYVASILDKYEIERPDHYKDDWIGRH
jgi:hypothetical protein